MHYDMLNKSELKITHIRLEETNLHEIADCVAKVYGIDRDKVLVIDVRNEEVALDILDGQIDPHSFMGKEKELLKMLSEVPGVVLGKRSHVTSDGMLGWIAFDAPKEEVEQALMDTEHMVEEAFRAVSRRVIIFPSGAEVEKGEIEDTNTPMLIDKFQKAGYQAEKGPVLKDSLDHIAANIARAIGKGYGIIITTGGVGAEDKDYSVEAIEELDYQAATPYIAKFQKGHGRHKKDGIRIGVGTVEHARIIALPGPNDEVSLCIPVLMEGLKRNSPKGELAEALAKVLRERLRNKCTHKEHKEKEGECKS